MGSGIHFDLTKLNTSIYSREDNVDILSFHLAAAESHDSITDDRDDCTSVGQRDSIERKTKLLMKNMMMIPISSKM